MFSSTDTQVQSALSDKESVQKEVKASLSQAATLSWEISDSKSEVKWYKDGKLISTTQAIHAESKGKSRQLVIDNVEKKDAGEYMCQAGSEKLVFKMHVEGKESEFSFVIVGTYLVCIIGSFILRCLACCALTSILQNGP